MTDYPSLTESAARDVEEFRYVFDNIRHQVGQVVVGQNEVVEHLLITLLVGGHCLITGMPGTAKTLLVRTLSEACLLYTSPSPRDQRGSRMPSSA